MLKARNRIAGQARDEVHVDVLMARPPGIGIAVQDILRRVPAANARQHLVREGLGVDGNAGGTILFDDSQLFSIGAVGAAASTVYSTTLERSKFSRTVPMSWRSWSADKLVGVPPPI